MILANYIALKFSFLNINYPAKSSHVNPKIISILSDYQISVTF